MFVVLYGDGSIGTTNARVYSTERKAKAYADLLVNNWKCVQVGKVEILGTAKRDVTWVKPK